FDNAFAGLAHGVEQYGLTERGRALVREMEQRKILVDLAHASPKTIEDVTAMATRPVVVSTQACAARAATAEISAMSGLALDNSRWISCRPRFLLPVPVLRRCSAARCWPSSSRLTLTNNSAFPVLWLRWLTLHVSTLCSRGCAASSGWVYAKPPFGGPRHVLKYLARYTHRVAIANGRLLSLRNGQLRFRWRDARDKNRIKVMSLDAVAFIRRFPPACAAFRLRQDPPLRSAGQPQSPTGARPLPPAPQGAGFSP